MRDVEWLKKEIEKNGKQTFLGFWGHKGSQMQACLSNFFPSTFQETIKIEEEHKEKSLTFTCTEQYMMYYKAMHFKDYEIAEQIINTPYTNPQIYKKLGRKVKNFDHIEWDKVCKSYVYEGCLLKFSQNKFLKKYLLSTGDKVLVEASPFDEIWGIGIPMSFKDWLNVNEWRGKNYLGFVLMSVRDELRKEMNENDKN